MNTNRIMWGLAALVVLITIAVSVGTLDSHSQQKGQNSSSKQDKGYEDLSKYAVVDYDAPLPDNVNEREKRKHKNERYDNQHWVVKNPHPDTSGVGLYDEIPPPPALPVEQSDVIVVGDIVSAKAFLSNDKRSVYTEFSINLEEIFKNDSIYRLEQTKFITADRAGGYVRYANGQKVLYRNSVKDLPRVEGRYLLFLTKDEHGPNYKILTGYELIENSVKPLDAEISFDDFKGMDEATFINAVRAKISQPINNQ